MSLKLQIRVRKTEKKTITVVGYDVVSIAARMVAIKAEMQR